MLFDLQGDRLSLRGDEVVRNFFSACKSFSHESGTLERNVLGEQF